jgi:hypothetical protein
MSASAYDPSSFQFVSPAASLFETKQRMPKEWKQMAMYLQKYTKVPMKDIYKMVEGATDAQFVNKLRAQMKRSKIEEHDCCCDCSPMAAALYNNSFIARAKQLRELFKRAANIERPSILDIGTEHINMLDALDQVFGTHDVRGLNIDVGFNHYNDVTKFRDKRFSLYDGTNIPDDINVDIITITAVLHHVPVANLGPLIASMSKHAKYVIVKENDLTNGYAACLFAFQHYLFENMIREEPMSYMNTAITRKMLDGHFAAAGMKRVVTDDLNNFNRTFFTVYARQK